MGTETVRRKPVGAKYRNLFRRNGVIYYQRRIAGKRIKLSTKTDDWTEAAAFRDLYEQRKGIGGSYFLAIEVPTLAEFSVRYLAEDVEHLAATTLEDRESQLRRDGPLLPFLGSRKLDEITPPILREWWSSEVLGRGKSVATGRSYMSTLSAIFAYAADLGLIEASPMPAFREQVRRRRRTKGARAESDSSAKIRPIESLDELQRFVAATFAEAAGDMGRHFAEQKEKKTRRRRSLDERTHGLRALAAVLLMLDGGFRVGEVAGLTWGQVRWGDDDDDATRAIVIDRSRPRGGEESAPKSGRRRVVALSRRLRRVLELLEAVQFEPGPAALVLPRFDPNNFTARPWRRILKAADIGHRSPKDLRDTFASWLLSLGVQLGYVSQQLGHADVAVTARHYARWCGGDVYRDPMPLEEGEVPADLVARAAEWHQGGTTQWQGWEREIEKLFDLAEIVEPTAGVEPATYALRMRCSTS